MKTTRQTEEQRENRLIRVLEFIFWGGVYGIFMVIASWFYYAAQNPVVENDTPYSKWVLGVFCAVFVVVFIWLTRQAIKVMKDLW